jgi:hypothetical protein
MKTLFKKLIISKLKAILILLQIAVKHQILIVQGNVNTLPIINARNVIN